METLEQHYAELLGLTQDWCVASVVLELEKQRVEITVEWTGSRQAPCPKCGKSVRVYDLRESRSWRHLDTMQFETVIHSRVPRVECPEHGVLTMETPWAGKHSRFTMMFEAFAVLVLQSCSTVEGARKLLGLSWEQVNDIRKRAVNRGLERRDREVIDYVGIDEKSFGSRHDYVSVLSDIAGGRVLEVTPGRKEEAAGELFESLSPEQRAGALAVVLDMWPAFMNAARKWLPEAVLVHDKFHVSKHLNDAVDRVRKDEHVRLMAKKDERLKGSKYLWLKGFERMDPQAKLRFNELKSSGLKVSRAWSMKDLFNEFWSFEFGWDAKEFFRDWCNWVMRSKLEPMKRVARMLKKHSSGLFGYIIHPITNAATEGLNSKIQNIKASARGFRRFDAYRTAILFYCGKLDMLPATVPQKS